MKTIVQIAKEIGVSKQAIYQFIDKDFKRKFSTVDGSLKINSKGQKLIKEHFEVDNLSESSSALKSALNNSTPLIEYLKDRIQEDRKQLDDYKDQIEQLHKLLEKQQALLEHEQQLRLADKKTEAKQIEQKIVKKKHWWQFGKHS